MENVVVLRYTEITLKGKNRAFFESLLVKNIKKTLKQYNISFSYIKKIKGRILVGVENENMVEEVFGSLSYVFGIQSLSIALLTKATLENMKEASLKVLKGEGFRTFRVSTKRGDKSFYKTSNEVERELGAFVAEKFGTTVDLKNFEKELKVEIFSGLAAVSVMSIQGAGGLPLGSGGNVFVCSDYVNYLAAAYYMMKRGCKVTFYGRKKPSEGLLRKYNVGLPMEFIEEKEDLLCTMERNFLHAFVVGEDERGFIETKKDFPKECLLLAPLVGFNEEYVNELEHYLGSV